MVISYVPLVWLEPAVLIVISFQLFVDLETTLLQVLPSVLCVSLVDTVPTVGIASSVLLGHSQT